MMISRGLLNIIKKLQTNSIDYLNRLPKSLLDVFAYLSLILIGIIDYKTGTELSVSLFYIIPITVVTWFRSRERGIMISVVSAFTLLLSDISSGYHFSHPLIPYWNVIIRFGFFITVSLLLSYLKEVLRLKDQLTKTDFLTGVANRRSFIDSAQSEINRARRYQYPFTIAYIDIDDFKDINDTYGHLVGDTLLCKVADTIRSNLRITDISARLGGDEFAVLFPNTDSEQSKIVINKMHDCLLDTMKKNNWPVTFSIGTVTFVKPPQSVDEIIRKADYFMYSAKKNGKNKIHRDL